uniref:transposase n=1 Tax=Polaromonas sp. TaxID=1869339 RepID=UPI0015EE418D
MVDESATGPAAHGVLIIDDTADRKESCAADHVARQYRISLGKIDNGIEPVIRLCADDKHYYPLHVASYTLAVQLSESKHDLMFRTKPLIALALVERSRLYWQTVFTARTMP